MAPSHTPSVALRVYGNATVNPKLWDVLGGGGTGKALDSRVVLNEALKPLIRLMKAQA